MIVFRHGSRVTLILGLAWVGLAACGSSDGDLFGSGNEVDANAGAGAGGEPDDGSGGLATGGRSTGGTAPTGGVSTGGVSTGGGSTGGAGTGGKPGELSCTDLSSKLGAEIDSIQSCESDEECGQPLQGTSCGCTRDLVARKDADVARFEELFREYGERCDGFGGSTCDCPAADGFKCASNRCSWNYQGQGACEDTEPGELCLKRDAGAAGATLKVGEKLAILVQPKGCFSSGCTAARISSCSIDTEGGDFAVNAEFCMASMSTESGGCTGDCSNDFAAQCQSEVTLTEGEHTVTLGDMSLTFTVPGAISEDALCVGSRF